MGAKTYVLMALPILVLVGMIALFVCLGRSRSPRLVAWADRLGLSLGARRADEMEPVSYTHLDVYKRQPVY